MQKSTVTGAIAWALIGAMVAAFFWNVAAPAFAQTAEGRFLRVWLNSACMVRTGSGTPESAVTGVICDVYLRTNGGAGTTLYVKESGAGNTGWIAPITEASTGTLTNKTISAEGTGNVMTVAFREDIQVGTCGGGVGWSNWELLTTSTDSPVLACIGGLSNGPFGTLEYEDDATQYAYNHLRLPADWSGNIDLEIGWLTSATTGNVRFLFQTACVAVGESVDPSWNTAQAIVDAAQGVTLRANTASQTAVTTTGCAAGEMFKFRLGRDPSDGGDTISATAHVYEFVLVIRRAM